MSFEFRWRRTLATLSLLILINGAVCAQAGRPRPLPPAEPTPDKPVGSEENRQSSKRKIEGKFDLIAAKYVSANNTSFETGVAFRSFLARLQESGFLIVSSREDVRRKEAIDLAQHGENVYVAWLQLEWESMGGADPRTDAERASLTPINPSCLFVTYAVYQPGTGKAIDQGHIYQPGYQDRCAGTVYHPSPYPDRTILGPTRVPEVELKRAGSAAADRVMAALNVPVPPVHR